MLQIGHFHELLQVTNVVVTDKTTRDESKADYASVLSGSSQTPKVKIGTENLLMAKDDEVRVPNMLYQQVDLSLKKQSVKLQSSNALMSLYDCMCHTLYIKSTDKLMICE